VQPKCCRAPREAQPRLAVKIARTHRRDFDALVRISQEDAITRRSLVTALAVVLTACATSNVVPNTIGDPQNAPVYGYHPIDPLPITTQVDPALAQPVTSASFLDLLPDETMRLAIGSVDASGNIFW
jgi:hypothetical protein